MLLLISVTSLLLLSSSLSMTSADKPISETELEYLLKYEYIPKASNNLADNFNNDNNGTELYNAISNMQKFFNLKVTGQMNDETSSSMRMPRCGVSDIKISNMAEYNTKTKWAKKHLTWKVVKHTKQVTPAEVNKVIAYSLSVWANVSGLTFEHKTDSDVDMEIGFYTGDHLTCRNAFDGRGGVLAHAYYPNSFYKIGGDTHMDDDEHWGITRKPTEYTKRSLAVVFVHEFGHALGLAHEPNVSDSVMRPIYSGWAEKVVLSKDDIAGIQSLYGKPPPSDTTTTVSPTTTTKQTTTTVSPTTTTKQTTTTLSPTTTTKQTTTTVSSTTTTQQTTTTVSPTPTTKQTTTTVKGDMFCLRDRIDAAVEHSKVAQLLFGGDIVRLVNIKGRKKNYKVNKFFLGSLKYIKIDAAIRTYIKKWTKIDNTWVKQSSGSNTVYLFQGSKVHSFIFSNRKYRETNVELISVKFPGLPINLDAAFNKGNTMIFIKGSTVYLVKESSNGFFLKTTNSLSKWKGLPNNIDAAIYLKKNRTTTFFTGNDYYKFLPKSLEVGPGYPKDVKSDWFKC